MKAKLYGNAIVKRKAICAAFLSRVECKETKNRGL